MNDLFGYPKPDKSGKMILTTTDGIYKKCLMNITVYNMAPNEELKFFEEDQEMAILLVSGELEYKYDNEVKKVKRDSFITQSLYCLHVCKGKTVTVKAYCKTQVLVQATKNERVFDSVFYTPDDCVDATAGSDLCDGTAVRTVRTAFDYKNAPYSNMVLGEIISHQGRWSSYIPHSHEQPEVYYYRFDKPQGFGACFIGDDVFKIKDESFSCITPNKTHPQVTAPGYPMYVVWMIRHLENNPWTTRVDDPDHLWMVDTPIKYR